MTRRSWLAALGVAAAALVAGVCVTVAYALSTGFDRAAQRADLPDVIARFDPIARERLDARLRTLPGLEARSYRFEDDRVLLRAGRDRTERGVVHVVEGGRRGYAIVAGHDLRPGAADVVVEQGLAREWGLRPGSTLTVGRLGPLRVAGEALEPDNVAFPVASAARVYVGPDEIDRVFGGVRLPVSLAQLWLRPGASSDVALAQARAQSFGVRGLSFITRRGVRSLIGQAAGIVVALLVAFSLVALGAAAVMLGTAAHAEVRRQLPSLAVRRALGFSRGALTRAAALRATALALPAATVGLAAGWLAARPPSNALLATLNETPPGAALAGPLALTLAAILVLVVAATTWPAWRATEGPPAALLRGGELVSRRRPRRTPLGGGFLALGARLPAARRARYAGTVAVIGSCAAVVLLMLALASLLERLRDDPATLGKRYALTVGGDPSLVSSVARTPGVAAVTPRWQLRVAASFALGDQLRLIAMPGDHVPFEAPPLAEGRRLRADGEAEVGLGLADALGLAPGATLAIQLGDGSERRFRVVGVVRALDNEGRVAYVRPGRLGSYLDGLGPALAVKLKPGADRATVARALSDRGFPPTRTAGAAGRNGRLLGVLGDVLRVIAGAVGLVVFYALAQALALTAAERRPTLALLRSLGAPPRTLARVLAGAGAAIVVPAALLAIALEELVLAPVVSDLAADYAELPLSAGLDQALLVVAGLLALALVAAAWVAWRVQRRPIAPALVAALLLFAGCGTASPSKSSDTRVATWRDADGDGRLEHGPGEPLVARGGAAGRTTAVLATFAQLTDAHVRDEESPARVPFLDRLGAPFTSTFRPQEALTAQVLEAAVESVDALRPDAVVVTGDLADNAQRNELALAMGVLRGGRVSPDSGAPGPSGPQLASDPDPFFYRPDVDAPRHPGLLAAAQEPFRSPGLRAPLHTLSGNHDLLVQGELAPDARARAAAVGDRAVVRLDVAGLRGVKPADAIDEVLARGQTTHVVPDRRRALVTTPPTHPATSFALGPGVRGISLDLVNRAGGSDGVVTPATLASLRAELARAGDRPVVVFSHQPLDRSAGGAAALQVLQSDPRVVAAVAGHTHRNAIRRRGRLWLITTSSLVDYPQQARAFRLVRTTRGLALETWMLDHGDGPRGLAKISRDLAFLDAQGGRPANFAGARGDRNARLLTNVRAP